MTSIHPITVSTYNTKRTVSSDEGVRITGLKAKSFDEYLAARCLFLNDCLEQAVSLSNTCIEKQLKAALAVCNIIFKWTHDTPTLLEKFQIALPEVGDLIQMKYLQRIYMIHELRYIDTPEKIKSLNYFISRNFYLAELDHSFYLLDKTSKIYRTTEGEGETAWEYAVKENMSLFHENNYLANGVSKTEIFKGEDYIEAYVTIPKYEMYKNSNYGKVDKFYENFDRDGFQVIGQTPTFIIPPQ